MLVHIWIYIVVLLHVCLLSLMWICFVFSQKAAPERSLCATVDAVSCLCLCVMVIPTATTKQTRPTAAINTKVRACRHSCCSSRALFLPKPNLSTECGGEKTGSYGYLSSPNHPRPYPHQQVQHDTAQRAAHWPDLETCLSTNLTSFFSPLAVHMVFNGGGGSRHHTELQEFQPGNSGRVWVWLRGSARQCWPRSWKGAGKVRLTTALWNKHVINRDFNS